MNILGLTILSTKALQQQLQAVVGWTRGWLRILESTTGAWQRNDEVTLENVTAHWAVFACISLISTDIGKMRLRLVEQDSDGIWSETENPAWSPVLRKPNHYQIRQKFFEWWTTSKLSHGNTYALKRRDNRSVVNGLYILDPCRVRPFIAPDGSVFYELRFNRDDISGLENVAEGDAVYAPAREIIHDIYIALFHPLIGVSPIYACGLAALQGMKIQNNSTKFFANGSQPGGILTAPGNIPQEKAQQLKDRWESAFSGDNAGKVAVLGDGLKYEPMMMTAVDAQLIEQLKFTAEAVCSAFRVPPHKISVGQMPNYNNIESLDLQYYSQCLQEKLETIESLLDDGLELPKPFGTEFNTDDLFSMDRSTLIKNAKEAGGVEMLNESRKRLNLKPVPGGNTIFRQQQDFSLEELNKRRADTLNAPAPTGVPPTPTPAAPAREDAGKDFAAALMTKMAPLAQKHAQVANAA